MAVRFKKGDKVRVIPRIIEGVVVDNRMVDGEVHAVVQWTEGNDQHERAFDENTLEPVK